MSSGASGGASSGGSGASSGGSGGASSGGNGGGRAARAERSGAVPEPPEPLPSDVLDSHCHLDIMGVGTTPEQVAAAVVAAQAVGVRRLVTIGVDVPSSRWCATAATWHDDVWAGVAIHPNDAPGAGDAEWDEIAALAQLPQVRAVGETGLDHYRTDEAGWAAQETSFRRHIDIAKRAGKALVIHDRDAHDDVVRVLRSEGAPERTVFHCFSGDTALARVCADEGWVASFAGNVTFASAGALREAAAVVPAELLLVETDAPFLTPVPHRGRPNAPVLVPHTVRALAAVRGADLASLCEAIAATGERVFGPW